ncbi:MAG: hypothetical protein WCC45_01055, partial [Paeniglutamicibacter sp.]
MKSTASAPRPPWLLLTCTLVLAVCGYLLLGTEPSPAPTGDKAQVRPSPQDTPAAQLPAGPAARARSPRTGT